MHTWYSYNLQFIGNGLKRIIIIDIIIYNCSQCKRESLSLKVSHDSMGFSLCFSAGVLLYSLALFLYCRAQQGWRSLMHKRVLVATATAWHSLDTQGRRSDAFVSVCVCVKQTVREREIVRQRSSQSRVHITSRIKHQQNSTNPIHWL